MRTTYSALVLCALMLAGCGGASTSSGGIAGNTVRSVRQNQNIEIMLTAPTTATVGQAIPLTLEIKNMGSAPFQTMDSPPEATAFVRQGETETWNSAHGLAFPAVVYEITIAPGQTKTYRWMWNGKNNDGQTVPAGTYQIGAAGIAGDAEPISLELR